MANNNSLEFFSEDEQSEEDKFQKKLLGATKSKGGIEEIKEKTKALQQKRNISEALKKVKKEYSNIKYNISPSTRRTDKKISQTARKVISKIAPKGGIVKALTQTTKKKSGRGRGRPSGTYKTRVLPSGRVVKVHTNVYKKLLSQEKAAMRLARVQRQFAMQAQADQLAMQQDPRFNQSSEDQFLAEPDQQHEMNVAMAQQQQQMQQQQEEMEPQQQRQSQQPGITRRILGGVSRIGTGLSRLGSPAQQQFSYDEYGRPVQRNINYGRQINPQMGSIIREPRVTAISGSASLLKVGNQINRTPQRQIARRRLRR